VLRGWTNYFRHGVAKNTFACLQQYTWWRVIRWLRRNHRRTNWTTPRRRRLNNSWWIERDGTALFDPRTVPVTRYRYRGTAIPTRWNTPTTSTTASSTPSKDDELIIVQARYHH
jgi:RNA-directed DNA polymerase